MTFFSRYTGTGKEFFLLKKEILKHELFNILKIYMHMTIVMFYLNQHSHLTLSFVLLLMMHYHILLAVIFLRIKDLRLSRGQEYVLENSKYY